MLKAVRNGLLGKDLHFIEGQKEKVVSWKHVMTLHENDKKGGVFIQFIKLTDEYVIPSKIRNLNQVFSHTVATSLHLTAKVSINLSETSEFYLHPQASDTADCLLFFDKIFDSVNGSLLTPPPDKELIEVCCDKKSKHLEF
nr:unnamed protein product [Callosobruchus analis]